MPPIETGYILILGGATVVTLACAWIAIAELRGAAGAPSAEVTTAPNERLHHAWWWGLALVIVVGTVVRLYGLDLKGLSHTEAYIPGLDLPAGISEPPPRHTFVETAKWHFYSEPHPFGYYLAMWGWTKTLGTSLTAIRAPEALLGVLSLWLIFRVGALAFGTRVGIVAAGLLSLHGFHTFWSQAARMYAPGAFFGLLSTWLLLTMSRQRRPPVWVEAGYVLTTVAGALTVEFFWPFLCVQILWIALSNRAARAPPPRVATIQALAFVLSAPMLSHALMLGRNNASPPPSLGFLRGFFSFGFLFDHGAHDQPDGAIPLVTAAAVLMLGLALLARGLGVKPRETVADPIGEPLRTLPLVVTAGGIALVMLGIAVIANSRRLPLAVLSVLPLLVVGLPVAAGALRRVAAGIAPGSARWLQQNSGSISLVTLLALVPTLLLFAASYRLKLTAPRAFLIFVPYLLIVVAAGAVALARTPLRAVAIATPLLAMFSASAVILHRTPISPRDYQGLARALTEKLRPDDLIFVRRRNWAVTPLFYYLDHRRLVAAEYREAVLKAPRSRVWTILLPGETGQKPVPQEIDALSGHRLADRIDALRAHAFLYVPAP